MISSTQDDDELDTAKVEAALRRASQNAKELAERTGTKFIVVDRSQATDSKDTGVSNST